MKLLKTEPAIIIGLVVTVLTTVGQVVSGDLTWAAAAPLIVAAVVRQFVTPVVDAPKPVDAPKAAA